MASSFGHYSENGTYRDRMSTLCISRSKLVTRRGGSRVKGPNSNVITWTRTRNKVELVLVQTL